MLRKKKIQSPTLQLVSWILGNCATLDEVKEAVKSVHVVNIDPRSSTVHWRFTDAEGKQLVLEITGQTPHFFENTLGVLTNSPGFEWQLTNLNNYVNLFPGTAPAQDLGTTPLKSFGAGSGFLGIPGDVTPRFTFRTCGFLSVDCPTAGFSRENSASGLSDSEQLRYSGRH